MREKSLSVHAKRILPYMENTPIEIKMSLPRLIFDQVPPPPPPPPQGILIQNNRNGQMNWMGKQTSQATVPLRPVTRIGEAYSRQSN